ncbi:MAG: XTP/dITP diphosphatase [Nitrososphaeria archaeon]|jgi:XTP/dITP diphosphohydrolase
MQPLIKIFFATKNKNKIYEARQILSKFGIKVEPVYTEKVELQAEKLEEIVAYALKQIKKQNRIVVIEDSGLFIDKLNGFPGPYSSFVFKKIGCDGILSLIANEQVRKAEFISVVGYKYKGRKMLFKEKTVGAISNIKVGKSGFGFDPIFIPEGNVKTFAQMSLFEKNQLSHRGKAFRALGEWLQKTKYI